jgi:formylglycine-generating enzyme
MRVFSLDRRGVSVVLVLLFLGLALALAATRLERKPVVRASPSGSAAAPPPSSGPSAAPTTSAPEVAPAATPPPLVDETPDTVPAQREIMFRNMQSQLGLSDEVMQKTRAIFDGSRWMSQGNPKITRHPMTRQACLEARAAHAPHAGDERCGAPNMVPIFDPGAGETAGRASVCVDQYEYPNVPCDYPVIWVKSDEAQLLCKAQGKRLCDAHEWEGACAGALHSPDVDYSFGERRLMQEYLHNKKREIRWAYGPTKNHPLCATGSHKSPKCYTPSWEECGSNTYPAGAFPGCVSSFGVYDQHGNAAEHMNLPLSAEELGSRGGTGENEMKGSWFIFAESSVHEDDCRWRALAWHAGKLMAPDAHRNYHLGFRCCRDL